MVSEKRPQSHKMAKRMVSLSLRRIESQTNNIKTFWFQPEDRFEYLAGQAAEFIIPHQSPDKRGDSRWFTLSSSPTETLLAITTRTGSSSFKQTLIKLKIGNKLQAMPAMGDFVLPKDPNIPIVFVAGGLGITPVRSIIKYLLDSKQERSISLIYSVSDSKEYIFRDILKSYPMKTTLHSTKNTERLNAKQVLGLADDVLSTYFYVSGPEAFTGYLAQNLKQSGISPNRIVADFFSGY